MACRLPVRYDENHLSGVRDLVYDIDKCVMRMSWSIVSNVVDRSSRVSVVTLSLSMLKLMSLCTVKRTISAK